MAATVIFGEDNGASAGNPAVGATRTFGRTECNWKNIDDSTSSYAAFPITTGTNSYPKYQFALFSGSFNAISDAKWGHTAGSFGAGINLFGKVSSGYATPALTLISSPVNITIASGLAAASQTVLFGTGGPQLAGAPTLNSTGYSMYLVTQASVGAAASAGDSAVATLSLQFNES